MVVITWDPELEAPPVEADDDSETQADEERDRVDEDRDWMLAGDVRSYLPETGG